MPVVTTRVDRVVDLPVRTVWDPLVDHEAMSSWGPRRGVTRDQEGSTGRDGVGAARRMAAPPPTLMTHPAAGAERFPLAAVDHALVRLLLRSLPSG